MNDTSEKIVSMVQVALPGTQVPTEDEIRDVVDRLAGVFGIGNDEKSQILQRVMAQRLVKMDTGFALCEEHLPWVDARRPQITPFYWSRFKLYLQTEKWPPGVITGLDRATDALLDLLGNPEEKGTWKRRGLVMGDVQSGKTATYSALICKAADAGYRFIVLLTGTIENLRRQTQERLDTGFVGFDSSEQLKRNGRNLRVGVGLLDGTRQATVFTSSAADFRVQTLEALGLSLDALKEPALVVIKKHARILTNLSEWLKNYNTGAQSGGIDIPMLLIDDEADNASINTNDEGLDPTKINAGIRELLRLFRRTTYVGFTATPFANIFVNPDSKEEMLGDDLFPRDFIYTLEAASNYFGPKRLFLDDTGATHLREITDVEEALPSPHKSTTVVTALPTSLVEALCAFLVANAIRDLRGDVKTHRSMLVNVSQFTNVQDQVESLLHSELERFRTAIRSFGGLPPDKALRDGSLRQLHQVWESEFRSCGFDWAAIQSALHAAVLPITTKAVNQRTGPRALDYRAYRETGLRVVAVGGNSLSRGLTLEGLMVSYFRRTTKMYDTLLQMGRWFGYRPGYEDLCRVWIPGSTKDWYGHISDATDELRDELRRMFRLKKTPKDFGLAVRAHPDSLLVTARNKMRTAAEITRIVSLSTQSFESVELPASASDLEWNFDKVAEFIALLTNRPRNGAEENGYLIQGATRAEVAGLLKLFRVPATEFRFQPDQIAELLDRLEGGVLNEWDVGIPSGSGGAAELDWLRIRKQSRTLRHEEPPGVFVVSGDKRRVASRGAERMGLTGTQIEAAKIAALNAAKEDAAREGKPEPEKVNVADRYYRAVRIRPLLLIHVLSGQTSDGHSLPAMRNGRELVAIGLSFPKMDDSTSLQVKYKINLVKAREMFSSITEPGDDEDNLQEEQP